MNRVARSEGHALISVSAGFDSTLGLSAARRIRSRLRRNRCETPLTVSFKGSDRCEDVFVGVGLSERLSEEWKERRRLAWAADLSPTLRIDLDRSLRASGLMMISLEGELLGAGPELRETISAARSLRPLFTSDELAGRLGRTELISRNRLQALSGLGIVERCGSQRWRLR
jgi:hypothetical protein